MERVRLVLKTDFSTRFHKFGFWILVAFIIGTITGNFYAGTLIDKRLNDAVTYKAIKIGATEYNLQARP